MRKPDDNFAALRAEIEEVSTALDQLVRQTPNGHLLGEIIAKVLNDRVVPRLVEVEQRIARSTTVDARNTALNAALQYLSHGGRGDLLPLAAEIEEYLLSGEYVSPLAVSARRTERPSAEFIASLFRPAEESVSDDEPGV